MVIMLPRQPKIVYHTGVGIHLGLTKGSISPFPHPNTILIRYELRGAKMIIAVIVYEIVDAVHPRQSTAPHVNIL